MRLAASDLDTLITLQRPVRAQEEVYGTSSPSFEDFAEVWAQVRDMLPSRAENIADGIDLAKRPARIRIRYRDDVTSAMRVRIGARVLEIVGGPAELGRRDGLEMVCEERSTSGGAP